MTAEGIAARVDEIAARHAHLEGPLLPVLHAVQAEWGHVPAAAVPAIARALNLAKAEVQGVVTFYHDFRAAPPGRHVLKLCRAEACQATGAGALAAAATARLGVDWHGTGRGVTLEPVFCLGLCACGPAAMLDGQPLGRLDAARLDAILAEIAA